MRTLKTHPRAVRAGVTTLALAAAVTGLSAASAQAATTATATSSPTSGMLYTGTTGNNVVSVTLKGTTFTVDDVVPITAGSGCAPVAGDSTKVTCAAPQSQFGKFLRFTVLGGVGRDIIVNQTTAGTALGAPMLARGGDGLDSLFGADRVSDELHGDNDGDVLRGGEIAGDPNGDDQLFGGSGDDNLKGGQGNDRLDGGLGTDTLDGEHGADRLDGGPGSDTINGGVNDNSWDRDVVDYTTRTARVTVSLAAPVATGQGEAGENDTISHVESIWGGAGDDSLTGNSGPNRISGGDGHDWIFGGAGLDVLEGQRGNDTLVPSPMTTFLIADPDGMKDILEGGDDPGGQDKDVAWRNSVDGDFINDCETIYQT